MNKTEVKQLLLVRHKPGDKERWVDIPAFLWPHYLQRKVDRPDRKQPLFTHGGPWKRPPSNWSGQQLRQVARELGLPHVTVWSILKTHKRLVREHGAEYFGEDLQPRG